MPSMHPKDCLDLVIKGGAFMAYGPEKIVRLDSWQPFIASRIR